jgi:hypothetical protein
MTSIGENLIRTKKKIFGEKKYLEKRTLQGSIYIFIKKY